MNIEFDKVGMVYRNGCEVRDIRTAAGSDNIFVLKRKTSGSREPLCEIPKKIRNNLKSYHFLVT